MLLDYLKDDSRAFGKFQNHGLGVRGFPETPAIDRLVNSID